VEELDPFIRKTFPDYYSAPANRHQLDGMAETAKRKLIRTLSIEQARKWWNTASPQWNRLEALEQALLSADEKCQIKALFYLRNGKTTCTRLTENFYKSRLENTIIKLTKSETNRVSENAKLIMLDSDYDWLLLKPVN
jgi:hypothetical protein